MIINSHITTITIQGSRFDRSKSTPLCECVSTLQDLWFIIPLQEQGPLPMVLATSSNGKTVLHPELEQIWHLACAPLKLMHNKDKKLNSLHFPHKWIQSKKVRPNLENISFTRCFEIYNVQVPHAPLRTPHPHTSRPDATRESQQCKETTYGDRERFNVSTQNTAFTLHPS